MKKNIPFFLVTGFLGSGKTTLLKRIINEYADSYNIAVIQNEFAPHNIDGKELQTTGKSFKLVEINKGSVFCVCLIDNFTEALSDLVDEYQPDAVFLEASGIADPITITQLLQSDLLKGKIFLAHVWCIVDSVNFNKLTSVNTRVIHQVRVADCIIINKKDLVANNSDEIVKQVKQINPLGNIIQTSYCDANLDDLLSFKGGAILNQHIEIPERKRSGRPDINTGVLKSGKKIRQEALDDFLRLVQKDTYRMKGYIQLNNNTHIAVQSVFDKLDTSPVDNFRGMTELVFVGPQLEIKNINKLYKYYSD